MININGEAWKVLLVSPNHPKLINHYGESALGACDDILKTIYINDSLNPLKTKKVLCHELTHAAMFSYNVNLTYEQEELLAELIATYGQEIILETNRIFNRLKREGFVI